MKEDLNLDDPGATESQNFDVVLEKHRHECETALESLLTTVQEGETLSQELLTEIKTAPGHDNRTSWILTGIQSPETSRVAVECYLKDLNQSRQQLESLWIGRKQKLDNWVKVKNFERDGNTLCVDSEAWMDAWQKRDLPTDVTRAQCTVDKFKQDYGEMMERYQQLLIGGQELENTLRTCGAEVTVTRADNTKQDGVLHIMEIVRKLQSNGESMKTVHGSLRMKFEFGLRSRKLEADAKKVSSWIRHGDNLLAASAHEAGTSMFEAEALLREYERFHTAIEVSSHVPYICSLQCLGVFYKRGNELENK